MLAACLLERNLSLKLAGLDTTTKDPLMAEMRGRQSILF